MEWRGVIVHGRMSAPDALSSLCPGVYPRAVARDGSSSPLARVLAEEGTRSDPASVRFLTLTRSLDFQKPLRWICCTTVLF